MVPAWNTAPLPQAAPFSEVVPFGVPTFKALLRTGDPHGHLSAHEEVAMSNGVFGMVHQHTLASAMHKVDASIDETWSPSCRSTEAHSTVSTASCDSWSFAQSRTARTNSDMSMSSPRYTDQFGRREPFGGVLPVALGHAVAARPLNSLHQRMNPEETSRPCIDSWSDSRSDCRSVVSTSNASSSKQSCHLIWCDHRAFKDASLKEKLETHVGSTVKMHKTAENCIRLFRKKERAQGRPPCVLLVSWSNAPALLSYLADASHVDATVVLLCDSRYHGRNSGTFESAVKLAEQFPFVKNVATTWEDAAESVRQAVAAVHSASA